VDGRLAAGAAEQGGEMKLDWKCRQLGWDGGQRWTCDLGDGVLLCVDSVWKKPDCFTVGHAGRKEMPLEQAKLAAIHKGIRDLRKSARTRAQIAHGLSKEYGEANRG
jgi:hypothetical protein